MSIEISSTMTPSGNIPGVVQEHARRHHDDDLVAAGMHYLELAERNTGWMRQELTIYAETCLALAVEPVAVVAE